MKVAFIGLGRMGAPMARRITEAQFEVTVYNRTGAKAAPFAELGARVAEFVAAAVAQADLVVTSLLDDHSALSLVQNDLLEWLPRGVLHLGTTTISPQCSDRLAELHRNAGSRYVAGPVVGRPDAADAGRLITYLAGDEADANAVRPLCLAYASAANYVGDRHGAANALKLCLNFFGSSFIELIGEVYAFGDKLGVEGKHVRDFLEAAVAHPALKAYVERISRRDFDATAGFAMEAGLKDLRLIREAAATAGANLEIATITERKMLAGVEDGMGKLDWSAIYELTRREMGLN